MLPFLLRLHRTRQAAKKLDRSASRLSLDRLEDRWLLSGAALPAPVPAYGVGPGGGWTPAQVRHAYGFDNVVFANGAVPANGSGETVAIVVSGDDPNIAADLQTFDQAFGLPAPPSFARVDQNGGGNLPAATGGAWAVETALDVEWAHAIAPGANILLVETNGSFNDFIAGINYARSQPGVVAVSMSFAEPELPNFTSYEGYFTTPAGHVDGYGRAGGVTFVAGSGDSSAGAEWPAVSPNVVSVGGTVLTADSAGNYQGESAWSYGGGGMSSYFGKPGYQYGVTPGGTRTTPDVSYNAGTGFAVYDTFGQSGWISVGGTSAGAPQWAALIAIADQGRAVNGQGSLDGPGQTLPWLYAQSASDFHDVTAGSNGYAATQGYDLSSGRGTPYADRLIRDLVGSSSTIVGGQHISAASSPPAARAPSSPGTPITLSGADLANVTVGGSSTIFAVTSNHALYRYQAGWGWALLGSPNSMLSVSAAADGAGNAIAFVITMNHGLSRFDPRTGWTTIGAAGSIESVSAGSDAQGQVEAFVVTKDGGLAEFTAYGWRLLGAPGTVANVSAGGNGRAAVVGSDGSVCVWNDAGGWSRLSSRGFAHTVAAVTDAWGSLSVYAVTGGQALYGWSAAAGWSQLGGAGSVVAASAGRDANGHAQALALNAVGTLSGYSQSAGWFALTGVDGARGASGSGDGNVAIEANDNSIQDYNPATGWATLTSAGFAS